MEELAKVTAREISECDERCFELLKLGRREHRRAGGVWNCGAAHGWRRECVMDFAFDNNPPKEEEQP